MPAAQQWPEVVTQTARREIARFSVESQRPSTFIDYATLAPFAMDGLGAALAMEDRNSGICL